MTLPKELEERLKTQVEIAEHQDMKRLYSDAVESSARWGINRGVELVTTDPTKYGLIEIEKVQMVSASLKKLSVIICRSKAGTDNPVYECGFNNSNPKETWDICEQVKLELADWEKLKGGGK